VGVEQVMRDTIECVIMKMKLFKVSHTAKFGQSGPLISYIYVQFLFWTLFNSGNEVLGSLLDSVQRIFTHDVGVGIAICQDSSSLAVLKKYTTR
jgi:hypothetical protein